MGIKASTDEAATQPMSAVVPGATSEILRLLMQLAIDGMAKFPGARASAGRQLEKANGDVEAAIRALAKQHTALAGAQGFVTNVGGVVTMMAAFPTNLAGLATIQTRMVAAIAHLRGYDLDDPRVRAAILMCLLGETEVKRLIASKDLPSTPQAVATAPLADPTLQETVGQLVLTTAVVRLTGKRFITVLARRIPVVGGGVGAFNDSLDTSTVAAYARRQFVSRRN
jgi:hypothetical protein